MLLDHLVVLAADPPTTAAALAGRVGRAWRDGGTSASGYRSAVVFLGDGLYLDVLRPARHRMDLAQPGVPRLAAWAVEVRRARRLARTLGLDFEAEEDGGDDPGGFAGWPEALASDGVLPCFAQVPAGLAGRADRARASWGGAGPGGVEAITLAGGPAERDAVERLLHAAAAAGGDDPHLDVALRWVPGPPRLVSVTVVTAAGPVEVSPPGGA